MMHKSMKSKTARSKDSANGLISSTKRPVLMFICVGRHLLPALRALFPTSSPEQPHEECNKKEQRDDDPGGTIPNSGDIEAHIAVERTDIKRNKGRYHLALLTQQIVLDTDTGIEAQTLARSGVVTGEFVERGRRIARHSKVDPHLLGFCCKGKVDIATRIDGVLRVVQHIGHLDRMRGATQGTCRGIGPVIDKGVAS